MHSRYLLIPTLALLAGVGVAQAADLDYQIHGFASQGYIRTDGALYDSGLYGRDTSAGTFEFNEFAINVMASPIERLRIGVQLSAYDLGKYGNDKVGVDWAFGEYQFKTNIDWLETSFVAGRFKTGIGFYNDYRDLDVTRTEVFLPRSTYSASFRDFFLAANGVQLNAKIDTSAAGRFSLSGFMGTQNFDESEGPIYDVFSSPFNGPTTTPAPGTTNTLSSFDKITLDRLSGGYVDWDTPLEGLRLKGSVLYAHQWTATGTMSTTLPIGLGGGTILSPVEIDVSHWFDIMTGFEYQWKDLTVASEVSTSYYNAVARVGSTDLPAAMRTLGTYLSANYQMSFLPGAWSRLSVYGAGTWDRSTDDYPGPSSPGSKSYVRSAIVALRYDIVDHFLVKGEFERVQSTNTAAVHTYGNVFSLKTTFDF